MTERAILDAALRRLTAAIDRLEGAAIRQHDGERARADVDAELAAAQDDRQRLAMELDEAMARISRLAAANAEIGRRVDAAMTDVRDVSAALAAVDR